MSTSGANGIGAGAVPPTVLSFGSRSLLLECTDLDEVMDWHARLLAASLPGQVEVIAAARTLLLRFARPAALTAARTLLDSGRPWPGDSETRRVGVASSTEPAGSGADPVTASAEPVLLDIVYDGPDLTETAELLGLSPEALIDTHSSQLWRAAFGGFAPGFMYCDSPGHHWDVPRLDSPRTRVPTGAVGLAGRFSGVYPQESPGGWRLIGHTQAQMWDSTRDRPALLVPGQRVRYRPVRARSVTGDTGSSPGPSTSETTSETASAPVGASRPAPTGTPVLRVEAPGLQALFQDLGRAGSGDLGVPASGAADSTAFAQLNRLLGNVSGATALELLLGGAEFTVLADCTAALTGAEATLTASCESPTGPRTESLPLRTPVRLPAGTRLRVGEPTRGLRSYLGVRGGFQAPTELGSASADLLSGLGPAALRPGDELSAGDAVRGLPGVGEPATPLPETDAEVQLRVQLGPREDWFAAESRTALFETLWETTRHSNRVGLRLTPAEAQNGPVLQRTGGAELPSEGMVAGALQVPPDGSPVVFLADHPVTGGYPVIATVITEDLGLAAQCPPGQRIRFIPETSPDDPAHMTPSDEQTPSGTTPRSTA